MGGGMEANKNKFIEDWGSARETLEQNFRWTRRNFALIGIFGIAVPILVYKGIVKEFHNYFWDYGRGYRLVGKFFVRKASGELKGGKRICKMKMQAGLTGSLCEFPKVV
ncbi:hypothetical protein POTOM_022856 [Populus tomentosa]|uniref:Uncharacterized protein n=1 Tax=Populus tomentosa TaxID=118781 RepID=A0A8X7ZHI4_POPTO|nr:hypothetical protein POTOM_022856 [Populus tomentosa]